MRTFYNIFLITFIGGIILIILGLFLKLSNQFSSGFIIGKYGVTHYGYINWFISIFLGIILLLMSIWTYNIHKADKKKFDEME